MKRRSISLPNRDASPLGAKPCAAQNGREHLRLPLRWQCDIPLATTASEEPCNLYTQGALLMPSLHIRLLGEFDLVYTGASGSSQVTTINTPRQQTPLHRAGIRKGGKMIRVSLLGPQPLEILLKQPVQQFLGYLWVFVDQLAKLEMPFHHFLQTVVENVVERQTSVLRRVDAHAGL